ncbi:hypothetical protein ACQP0I_14895 [Micromonospora carbonacea]|uniref:hypothetical protein n=1 Tax=Micromonospora carbonacea TaxID=47853 RepID=UPI003D98D32D
MRPAPGDLLTVDGHASVQFTGDRAVTFRVVSVPDLPTYHGWIWLAGYVLDQRDLATARREIYVQLAGLRPAAPATAAVPRRPPSRPAQRSASTPSGVGRVSGRRR